MKKLEMKDLTEAEKAEIALLVQKAQANADHTLTNGERNKIREAGRQKIAADRAQAAKAASALAREKAKERARQHECSQMTLLQKRGLAERHVISLKRAAGGAWQLMHTRIKRLSSHH